MLHEPLLFSLFRNKTFVPFVRLEKLLLHHSGFSPHTLSENMALLRVLTMLTITSPSNIGLITMNNLILVAKWAVCGLSPRETGPPQPPSVTQMDKKKPNPYHSISLDDNIQLLFQNLIIKIYRKTLCPVPPLNDWVPFDFERRTGQRVLAF